MIIFKIIFKTMSNKVFKHDKILICNETREIICLNGLHQNWKQHHKTMGEQIIFRIDKKLFSLQI